MYILILNRDEAATLEYRQRSTLVRIG
jgi:hypothetical protein